ncbi:MULTISPECIES: hypothetical protein [Thalassobacter]|uniref:hypothetical protein n=1 Tax=Thalassobacter TaxID=266808 RepID=UPI00190F8AE3|nr:MULTISPECIES: hypothetical protein [Thalassobacter]
MPLNVRQIKILNRLPDGLERRMTTSKWAIIANCTQDSANRDIPSLIEMGLLQKGKAGGWRHNASTQDCPSSHGQINPLQSG